MWTSPSPKAGKSSRCWQRGRTFVLENYDPGYLDSLGIGYRQLRKLNRRLIYVAVTGFGSFGADSWRKPFDSAIQAMTTVPSFSGPFDMSQPTMERAQEAGYVPSRAGWPLGFYTGGVSAAVGVAAALYYRAKSGKGQMVDVASYAHCLRWCDCSFDWYSMTGNIRRQFGNLDFEINPYGLHRAKSDEFGDRFSVIAAIGPVWPRLCECIGTGNMKKWETEHPTNVERIGWKEQVEINTEIDKWTGEHTLDEIDKEGMKWGFAGAGCKNIKEICESPISWTGPPSRRWMIRFTAECWFRGAVPTSISPRAESSGSISPWVGTMRPSCASTADCLLRT